MKIFVSDWKKLEDYDNIVLYNHSIMGTCLILLDFTWYGLGERDFYG